MWPKVRTPRRSAIARARRAEHERYTAEIIRLETTLNEHVYALFDLTADEIKLIEESTKYRYGEV
jgi:hypothetical protein